MKCKGKSSGRRFFSLGKREVEEEDLCPCYSLLPALNATVLGCDAWNCCSHFVTVRQKTRKVRDVNHKSYHY